MSFTTTKENAMARFKIIHAWKDTEYRLSLSEAERAQLPDHPAGTVELTDADLDAVVGGISSPAPACSEGDYCATGAAYPYC
jgi:mersacidin/lichenicidin family type 2 lantibiotic